MVGLGGIFRIMEIWDPTMVGVEGTLKIITPRDPTRVRVERTFRIMEPCDPTRVGVGGPVGSWNHGILKWLGWRGYLGS